MAASLAGTDGRFAQDQANDIRLRSAAIRRGERQLGTVVSGISLEPYERSVSRALLFSAVFALTILLLIMVGVRWVVASALRPVAG